MSKLTEVGVIDTSRKSEVGSKFNSPLPWPRPQGLIISNVVVNLKSCLITDKVDGIKVANETLAHRLEIYCDEVLWFSLVFFFLGGGGD